MKSHSPAVEDYLRAIYQLSEVHYDAAVTSSRVTTSSIAIRLDVRPASVTAMLQKMAAADPALVDYHKSFGARLTPAGAQVALSVVRCHRLLETYLYEKLGFGWDEVHDEADRLEHAISEEMADRLSVALGHPTRDPHGHAIPAADLSLDLAPVYPLPDLRTGNRAMVEYVQDDDATLLRDLEAIGVRPGAQIEMVDPAGTSDTVRVRVGDEREASVLSVAAALAVFVGAPGE